ncbi:MAG: hypothetical protein MJ189_01575, partial [Coriobacteriales bacterium]|nr:hypothetical protein [Coriobacteriales bacterium]
LILDMISKGLCAKSIALYIGYAREVNMQDYVNYEQGLQENLALQDQSLEKAKIDANNETFVGEHGKVYLNKKQGAFYGGQCSTGGTRVISIATSSHELLRKALEALYVETTIPNAPIRKITLSFGRVIPQDFATYNIFCDVDKMDAELELNKTVIAIKEKFGKSAILRANSLCENAMALERNDQVGGHRG